MHIFSITLIAGGAVVGFLLSLVSRANKKVVCFLAGLTILAGIAVMIQDRIVEITIPGVASIKAAREQSEEDAEVIAGIRSDLEQLASENENLKEASARADDLIAELSDAVDFQATALAADNDSRTAWDQLRDWAEDPAFPFQEQAALSWRRILEDHSQPFFRTGMEVPWREGLDPSSLALDDLRNTYAESPDWLKPALLEYIWSREDIPRAERMAFLVDVIRYDDSLSAVEYAGRFFLRGAALEGSPMDVDMILQWWEENSETLQ